MLSVAGISFEASRAMEGTVGLGSQPTIAVPGNGRNDSGIDKDSARHAGANK
jgi:hypothetical protein